MLRKFIKQLFTDVDNETYDTTRAIFIFTWLYVLVLQSVHYSSFEVQQFGIGMGALTAAFGLSKAGEARIG